MSTKLIETNMCINLGSIDTEDMCCDCCGKKTGKLKPFGNAGGPLVVDLDGQSLAKTFRPLIPRDKNLERLVDGHFGESVFGEEYERRRQLFADKFGEDAAVDLVLYMSASIMADKVYLCRDCFVLSNEEYFKKLSYRTKTVDSEEPIFPVF